MQIALVAVVLLAGMWFTVLKPKPASDSVAPAAGAPAEPVAPGVKGLVSAVDKAKAVSAKSDATNAKIESASGSAATVSGSPAEKAATKAPVAKAAPATKAKAKAPARAKATAKAATGAAAAKAGTKAATAKAVAAAPKAKAKPATPVAAKPATTKAATPATAVDPSDRLLAYLDKGKTLVILFEGNGAVDKAARKAVHLTAQGDPKHVVSAYIPISQVGKYEAITTDVQILSSPTVLVIGTDGKATALTGFVDVQSLRQAVGDARREAAAAKKTTTAKK
jgi:hypothetical protein